MTSSTMYHMSTWSMALLFCICAAGLLRVLSWIMQPKRSAQYYAAKLIMGKPAEPYSPFAWFQTYQDVVVGIALFMTVVSICEMVNNVFARR